MNLQMDQSGTCPSDMSFRDVLLDMSFTFGGIGATSAAGMLERIQQSTVHVIEVAKISQRQPGAAGFSCSKFNLSNSHVLAMRRVLLGIPHRWW